MYVYFPKPIFMKVWVLVTEEFQIIFLKHQKCKNVIIAETDFIRMRQRKGKNKNEYEQMSVCQC